MTILADAKLMLDLGATEAASAASTDFDGRLALIVAGVLADAEDFIGVKFQAGASIEELFDGGVSTLYLGYFNPSSVVVTENGVVVSSDYYEIYSAFPASRITLLYDRKFRKGNRNVKVAYTGGYDEDVIPVALRSKLLKQITYEFRRRRDPGLSSVSFPDGSVNKFAIGEWLPDVEKTLERLRRIAL